MGAANFLFHVHVDTFEGCFRALSEIPEKLLLIILP